MKGSALIVGLSGLWGAVGAGLMAAGSHADPRLGTAGLILTLHGLAAMAVTSQAVVEGVMKRLARALMLLGSGLFAGEIALHVLGHVTALGALAPIGGVLCIAGWGLVTVGAFTGRREAL